MAEIFTEIFEEIMKPDFRIHLSQLSMITFKSFERGQTIYTSGEPFKGIYAISFGATKTFTNIDDGEALVAISLHGDVLGLDSLSSNVYESTVTSVSATKVLWVPAECLPVLLRLSAQFRSYLDRAMGRAIEESKTMMCVLAKANADARIAYLLLKISAPHRLSGPIVRTALVELTRAEMGEYLGIRFETVSRKLGSLSRLGHIRLAGKAVHVRNSEALKEICGSFSVPERWDSQL